VIGTPHPQGPDTDTCGALRPRSYCIRRFHPEDPKAHAWPGSIANAQEGANRNADPHSSAYENGGAPPNPTNESTAQTPTDADIRWQVQEVYAVGYGNSTGNSARDHHLAGLDAVADLLINRHRRP